MSEQKSIVNPTIDAICVGGLSIAVLFYVLMTAPTMTNEEVIENFVFLSAVINFPHFIATYILLYTSPTTVKTYRWSSTWMPLLLALYGVVAALIAPTTDVLLTVMTFSSGAYLAWHYTGQTWGMMSVFSVLSGSPFNDSEKVLIRGGLRVFLVFHLYWFGMLAVGKSADLAPIVFDVYPFIAGGLILLASGLGVTGLYRYTKRIGRLPDPRVLISFVAVVLWYLLISLEPTAIFWVQISHALQYMLFPARIEINRETIKRGSFGVVGAMKYIALLAGLTCTVFLGLPWLIEQFVRHHEIREGLKEALVAFVNIHHFFADGALWKISNPEVKKQLFAHVKR